MPIKKKIRTVPDYPKKGIMFRDITTLIKDPVGFRLVIDNLTQRYLSDENEFDIIVCFEALEHISDHESLLTEVKRLQKNDGLFVVSTPNKITYTEIPQIDNIF